MKMTNALASVFLFVGLGGTIDASGGFAAYGTVANDRVVTPTGRLVEEALLNFRIEEVVEPSSGCAADQKVEREKRLLDPQLSPSNKKNNSDSVNSAQCHNTESTRPMSR